MSCATRMERSVLSGASQTRKKERPECNEKESMVVGQKALFEKGQNCLFLPFPPQADALSPTPRSYGGTDEALSTGPAVAGVPVAPPNYYASQKWAQTHNAAAPPARAAAQPTEQVPDTPAALARVAAGDMSRSFARMVAHAAASFEVHSGATPPARAPPTCFLLSHGETDGQAAMFTLPTRLAADAQESQMADALGLPSGALTVSDLRDGVLAFADEDAACAFADELLSDGHDGLALASVETASLFQLTSSAGAVVIWFPAQPSEAPPRPAELELVLRAHGW